MTLLPGRCRGGRVVGYHRATASAPPFALCPLPSICTHCALLLSSPSQAAALFPSPLALPLPSISLSCSPVHLFFAPPVCSPLHPSFLIPLHPSHCSCDASKEEHQTRHALPKQVPAGLTPPRRDQLHGGARRRQARGEARRGRQVAEAQVFVCICEQVSEVLRSASMRLCGAGDTSLPPS